MRADALARRARRAPGPTIVCAQAGNVNTGAFDPLDEIADACERAGAWLHVDGAFGLWAAASPRFRHLVAGVERADSWATDAHKWLNVPYDSGLVFCRHPEAQAERWRSRPATSSAPTAAARPTGCRSPRGGRAGFAVYAALRSLGRRGVAELVERCCEHARSFADLLGAAAGGRDPERRRPQPGARALRRRRRADARGRSRACRTTAPAGSAAPTGTAAPRCGSRSRASGRLTRTSSAPRVRS